MPKHGSPLTTEEHVADAGDALIPDLQVAMKAALTHRAYLFALRQPDPSGQKVSAVDARAMVVAYIQATAVKISVDLPPEAADDEPWRG